MGKVSNKLKGILLATSLAVGVAVGIASNKGFGALYASTAPIAFTNLGNSKVGQNKDQDMSTTEVTEPTEFYNSSYTFKYCNGKKQNSAILLTQKAGYFFNVTEMPDAISKINVVTPSGASGKAKYGVAFSTTAYTSFTVNNSGTVNIGADSNHDFTCSVANARYFCVYVDSKQSNNGQVKDITVTFTSPSGGSSSSSIGAYGNSSSSLISSSVAPVTYTVTYNPVSDSGTGTGTITDGSSPYVSGSEVTVKSSTGFTAPDNKDFYYWYTTASGTGGTKYYPGDKFNISADTTLYAQWGDGINLTQATSGITGSSYGSGAERTWTQRGVGFGAKAVMKSGDLLQIQASNGRFYNTSAFAGSIARITLTQTGSLSWSLACGSSSRLVNSTSGNYNVTGGSTTGITAPSAGTSMTWTIAQAQDYNYFCLSYSGANAGYVSSILIELRTPNIYATINGDSSVIVGSEWSPESVTENVSNNAVTGMTFAFAASNDAVISASNASTGAFTCSAAGTVTVSATKQGYIIANKVVTVNSIAPYINLTLNTSDEAFTGQTVDISAEFGNGVAGLDWEVTSGTVSGITSSNSGFSATIGGDDGDILVITATDTGSSLSEDVYIDVTKVTLTLDASTLSIAQTMNKTLIATHNASAVGGVTWSSNNAKVTVENGVVTVASDAAIGSTATITATSSVDLSVSATCTVTVLKAPVVYTITSKTAVSTSGIAPTGTTASFAQTYDTLSQATKDNSFTLTISGFTKPTAIKNITLNMHSNTGATGSYGKLYYSADGGADTYLIGDSESGVQFNNWGDNTELTNTYKDVVVGTDLGIVVENSFTLVIYCTSNSLYCKGYTIDYGDETEDLVESMLTNTKLSYRYESDGNGGFDYSDVSIRFGAVISKDMWDALDTNEHLITGFGVMIASGETITGSYKIKDFAELAIPSTSNDPAPDITNDVVDYFMPRASMTTPPDNIENNDNYAWNLFYRIANTDMDDVFVAAAYIKVGSEYVFLRQVRYSVVTLAQDYLSNRNCNEETAGGSLQYIVDHAAQA